MRAGPPTTAEVNPSSGAIAWPQATQGSFHNSLQLLERQHPGLHGGRLGLEDAGLFGEGVHALASKHGGPIASFMFRMPKSLKEPFFFSPLAARSTTAFNASFTYFGFTPAASAAALATALWDIAAAPFMAAPFMALATMLLTVNHEPTCTRDRTPTTTCAKRRQRIVAYW